MDSLVVIFGLIAQVDQGWREEYRSDDGGGSLFPGIILLAVLGFVIAWVRKKSESTAFYLMAGGVLYGSFINAKQADKILMFPLALIGFGFLASLLWLVSGFFVGKD